MLLTLLNPGQVAGVSSFLRLHNHLPCSGTLSSPPLLQVGHYHNHIGDDDDNDIMNIRLPMVTMWKM